MRGRRAARSAEVIPDRARSFAAMNIEWNSLAPIPPIRPLSPQYEVDVESAESIAPAGEEIFAAGNMPVSMNLTPDILRSALLEIGVIADEESMELAESFARLGLPLTEGNMTEGRSILARYPKLPVAAYAMAKIIDAPLSAGVLRGLARVIESSLATRPLASEILEQLGISVDASGDTRNIARELYRVISRLGGSTEMRLLQNELTGELTPEQVVASDPRTQLLAMAEQLQDRNARLAADAHAAHIEGQQILNRIALQRFDPPVPLYFSFPLRLSNGESTPAEIQIWTRDQDKKQPQGEFDESALALQTVIRVTTLRLGLIEARLTGLQDASLDCLVLVERPLAWRLLRRSTADLASRLSSAGWHVGTVEVAMAEGFAPLWYGGESLTHPRGRVDQKI
jgi:hypothetical protein